MLSVHCELWKYSKVIRSVKLFGKYQVPRNYFRNISSSLSAWVSLSLECNFDV